MSVKLEIKKADGSIYWIEHFENGADADTWLTEEKTRPYWDSSYTTTIEELVTDMQLSAQDIINQEALRYLADTDYKVIKAMELGLELDPIIKQLRQEARNKVI